MCTLICLIHWKLDSVHRIGLKMAHENFDAIKTLVYRHVHNICKCVVPACNYFKFLEEIIFPVQISKFVNKKCILLFAFFLIRFNLSVYIFALFLSKNKVPSYLRWWIQKYVSRYNGNWITWKACSVIWNSCTGNAKG